MKFLLIVLLNCAFLLAGIAQSKIDSIESILSNSTDPIETFELQYELARLNSRTNPEKSLEYARLAFETADKTSDKQLKAKALNGLAIANYTQGYNSISIKYFEELILIYSQLHQQNSLDTEIGLRLANTQSNLGVCYKNTGEYNQALENNYKALRIIEPLLNNSSENPEIPDQHIHVLNNIGILHMNLLEYEKALDNISVALAESRENHFDHLTALCLNNLGLINIEKQNYNEAENNYLEAVKINIGIGDSISIGGNYNNLGLIFEKQEKWEVALDFYERSLAINKRLGYNWGIANTLGNMGKIYFQTNLFFKAQQILHEALVIAQKTDDKNLINKIHRYHYELYNRKGDNAKALEYFLLFTQLKDSIFTEEKAGQIAEIEIKYETEKKEKENLALLKNNEIQQLKITRKNNQVLFLIIASAALLLFVVVILVMYRQKDMAYRNIVMKNQEIVAVERQLHKNSFKTTASPERKDTVSIGENETKEILIGTLEKYLTEEKPYLSPDITLNEICKHIATNRSYLSKVINDQYLQNFNTWINGYRVKEARRLLSDQRYDHISIEGIGEMSGFNSKATFHATFKKTIGVTPLYYRQKRA